MNQQEPLVPKDSDNVPLYFDKTNSPKMKYATYILNIVSIFFVFLTIITATVKFIINIHSGFEYLLIVANVCIFSHFLFFISILLRYNIIPKETVWYIFILGFLNIVNSVSNDFFIILN